MIWWNQCTNFNQLNKVCWNVCVKMCVANLSFKIKIDSNNISINLKTQINFIFLMANDFFSSEF